MGENACSGMNAQPVAAAVVSPSSSQASTRPQVGHQTADMRSSGYVHNVPVYERR
jgi:hypothetical protein